MRGKEREKLSECMLAPVTGVGRSSDLIRTCVRARALEVLLAVVAGGG